jgi:hypothetical protein
LAAEGTTAVVTGESDGAGVYRLTIEAVRALNRSVGASDDDLDRLAAVLDSPDLVIVGVTLMTVRARQPVGA